MLADRFQAAIRHHQAEAWQEARTAYEACLEINPHHPHVLANLGSVYRQLGLTEKALDCLLRATAVAPDDAGTHYNLGNLYRSQNQLEYAVQSYRLSLTCATSPKQTAQTAYHQACAANPDHTDAALNTEACGITN